MKIATVVAPSMRAGPPIPAWVPRSEASSPSRPQLTLPEDIFQHDDGRIEHHARGKCQSGQGDDVQGSARAILSTMKRCKKAQGMDSATIRVARNLRRNHHNTTIASVMPIIRLLRTILMDALTYKD